MAGMPIALVRDRSGRLRAFYDVCKHRAHELLSGSGTTPTSTRPPPRWPNSRRTWQPVGISSPALQFCPLA
ncbi:Rieske 2Fe-2S domain-containing protein [Actinoplanes sp. NPDC049668]|uniref:Rieske 2Fe-2S domain-containing protein n=1 Tax=unclassified Actinoplanes TaxID=2626549 RepID=UPI0033B8C4C0